MKEYIEREAVVKLAWLADYGDVVNLHDIMDIPAADVVEVRYGRVMVHNGHEDEYYEYCSSVNYCFFPGCILKLCFYC